MAHPLRMSATNAGLLVVDVQEKLVPLLAKPAIMVRNIAFLIDAARLLDVPVQATEQYPKGLGPTVAELAERLPERASKQAFSCCAVSSIVDNFRKAGRTNILLAGIEAHVCVLHTALDLLAEGFRVYVAADAVASRDVSDHVFALKRMEQAGVVITTSETVAFEWVGTADSPHFKVISQLVQERMKALKQTFS